MANDLNVGPQDLLPTGNNPFLLSQPEFVAVQTYVYAGMQLPDSNQDMQLKLGISAKDVEQFSDLVTAYQSVVNHCSHFQTVVFPMTVSLAADISHYAQKATVYYGALNPIIDAWNNGSMTPEQAQAKLSAIVKTLRDTAQTYATNAATARDSIIQFTQDTQNDQNVLTPIQQRYHDKYAGQGGLIQTYLDQIDTDRKQISYWNDQYQYDVTVAATTPTYAWVPVVGLIAASIVAGIYGKRASDALDHIHEYQDKLAQAQDNLREAITLMNDLSLASNSLDGIVAKLQAALPVLEKMEGVWGAIADDLTNVLNIIDNEITGAPAIIKDLGVADAIASWSKLGAIADNYRANAYIQVKTLTEVQSNPDKYKINAA